MKIILKFNKKQNKRRLSHKVDVEAKLFYLGFQYNKEYF